MTEQDRIDSEDGSCSCGGHAIQRENKTTHQPFWGCSNFPVCRATMRYPYDGPAGDLLCSGDGYLQAFADAFYGWGW